MRAGLIGFLLGAVLALLALFLIERQLIAPVAAGLSYHMETCVFDGEDFPGGDLDNGRLVRRSLVPVKITTTFYDAQYHEVARAEKPGRYGAVVRIEVAGVKSYRFITLYRTPAKVFWEMTPIGISAQLPAALDLDPTVLRAQQHDISEMIQRGMVNDDGTVSESMAILLAGLLETPPDASPAVERTGVLARNEIWWEGLREHLGLSAKYPHLVDLPKNYDSNSSQKWPLILFLADAGDRGDDVQIVRHVGLAGLIAQGKQLPAIVVTPVCPISDFWRPRVLSRLLDEVCVKYAVDPDRIYVTGISAGGDATWGLGCLQPERFAALAPINGEGDFADAARLKNIPLWTFQGLKDDMVPPPMTINMAGAIRQAGGHPHLTLYPDAGHAEAWDLAYGTDALYTWMLAQKRGQPEVITPGVPVAVTPPAPGPTADHR
jgi:pimeloyl-ACP methyl ester carboxylesterase